MQSNNRLRVFGNRVLRGIFVPKREEVTRGCRSLHTEELHNFIETRRMRWVGHVERMGYMINVYKILIGEPEEKRSLVRPSSRLGG
jgi:hypothetical protein